MTIKEINHDMMIMIMIMIIKKINEIIKIINEIIKKINEIIKIRMMIMIMIIKKINEIIKIIMIMIKIIIREETPTRKVKLRQSCKRDELLMLRVLW